MQNPPPVPLRPWWLSPITSMSLTTRFVVVSLIIVSLIAFGEAYHERLNRAHLENARLSQIAAQQRVLSKHLVNAALLAVASTDSQKEANAIAQLRDSIKHWRAGRQAMLEGASAVSLDTPALMARLRDVDPHAEAMSDAAVRLVEELERLPHGRRGEAMDEMETLLGTEAAFFGAMEEVMLAIVNDYDLEIAGILERDRVRLYMLLATLLLEALLVFIPAIAMIRSSFRQLRTTNASLDAALIDAHAAIKLKADFLATTSHELRTPLNAVIGLSSLLRRSTLDDQQRQFVETINHSGENLLQLINDILDLSKMEAGKLELEAMDFDLRELVESSVETLALRAEAQQIELAEMMTADVPDWARGDAGRVRQVLLNLLSNAVKFTDHGHVFVRVCVSPDARANVVRFEVEDTGAGIPEHIQAQLFQPFVQADASTTRRYGGTGLGLSISRRLVELMGGTIGVVSTPGSGSTFWFELPLPPAATGMVTDEFVSAVLSGKRVLVVDDTPANRLVLMNMLSGWHVTPADVGNGEAALAELRAAAARHEPYDVAIVDWHMPGMDGFMLASEIRGDARINAMKLVLLSSFSRGGDDARAKTGGFDVGLVKPVRQRVLLRALCGLYERRSQPREKRQTDLPKFPGARVLVADDNAVNVLVARSMLQQMSIDVQTAANGIEVLAALDRTTFDAILMDVQMPELDGPDATRELRRRELVLGTRIPVIAMTAAAMPEDHKMCIDSGMDDYITKPVALEVMAATMQRWLGALSVAGD